MSVRARRPTQSQQRPPFQHQTSSNFTSTPATPGGATRLPATTTEQTKPQPSPYKALQHKHAHHLHSIPPREKSTRTLIIDHMLWIHTRARLQQARAELGMKVSVKDVKKPDVPDGHSGFNFNFNEESESSDGSGSGFDSGDAEGLLAVKFGAKDRERDMRSHIEDEHQVAQDLTMAHSLRLHADGLEKVLTAMLDQPLAGVRTAVIAGYDDFSIFLRSARYLEMASDTSSSISSALGRAMARRYGAGKGQKRDDLCGTI